MSLPLVPSDRSDYALAVCPLFLRYCYSFPIRLNVVIALDGSKDLEHLNECIETCFMLAKVLLSLYS